MSGSHLLSDILTYAAVQTWKTRMQKIQSFSML